jgi:hypothetical protein
LPAKAKKGNHNKISQPEITLHTLVTVTTPWSINQFAIYLRQSSTLTKTIKHNCIVSSNANEKGWSNDHPEKELAF